MMRDVFQRATDQVLISKATIELASIQFAQGDKAGALASYQRLVLLGKYEDPAIRPLLREAILRSVELFQSMGRWQDVIENADRYTSEFPSADRIEEVRRIRAEAIVNLSMRAQS